MTSILDYMTQIHRACDDRFAQAEEAISSADWSTAGSGWDSFTADLEHHLRQEEELLFPAFEARTGNTSGPTAVMKVEHQQMRDLLQQVGQAISDQDSDTALDLTETLMVLMQQHNMKEEQILYPMSDQVLEDADQMSQRLAAF